MPRGAPFLGKGCRHTPMRAWLSPSQLSGAERPTKQADGLVPSHCTSRSAQTPRAPAPRPAGSTPGG